MRMPAAVWALALALGGCTPLESPLTPTSEDQEARWQQHLQQVQALQHWELRGRFGVMWSEGQVQGSITWQQKGERYEMSLRGPFGINAMRLSGDLQSGEALLQDGEQQRSGAVESLMQQHLGFVLPLSELVHLARGIPTPGDWDVVINDQAQAQRLLRDGWTVDYQQYSCCAQPALPERLRFESEGLRGALAVEEWIRY